MVIHIILLLCSVLILIPLHMVHTYPLIPDSSPFEVFIHSKANDKRIAINPRGAVTSYSTIYARGSTRTREDTNYWEVVKHGEMCWRSNLYRHQWNLLNSFLLREILHQALKLFTSSLSLSLCQEKSRFSYLKFPLIITNWWFDGVVDIKVEQSQI